MNPHNHNATPTITTTTTGPHVAVFAFPFATHAAPLLTIIRRLATATPTTHFSFFSTAKSNAFTFSDGPQQDNVKPYDIHDGVPEGYVFAGKPQEDIELFMNAAAKSFSSGVEAAVAETGWPVSCVVADAFLWFTAEAAEEMGVPWVPFWTAGPASLSAHVYTDLIRDTIGVGGIKGREDELLEFIPGMSKVRIRDLPEGIVFGRLDTILSHTLHKMGEVLPRAAAAVFINSFEELDLTITNDLNSKFKTFLNVGPINMIPSQPSVLPLLDTSGCLPWLDKQKPTSVAYISFGSFAMPSANELSTLAEALRESRVPYLWSLRDRYREHLPKGFVEETSVYGLVVPWAPQVQVLGHSSIGVFITHCGWNSLLESVAGGVRMICRPFFGDQRLNGRMIEDVWEIGVKINGGIFTKDGVLSSLKDILSSDKGEKMRDNVRGLKGRAIAAIGSQGSSSNDFGTLVELVSTHKVV